MLSPATRTRNVAGRFAIRRPLQVDLLLNEVVCRAGEAGRDWPQQQGKRARLDNSGIKDLQHTAPLICDENE
jgi:hypothetical protein